MGGREREYEGTREGDERGWEGARRGKGVRESEREDDKGRGGRRGREEGEGSVWKQAGVVGGRRGKGVRE